MLEWRSWRLLLDRRGKGRGAAAQGPSRSRSPAWVPVAGRWSVPGGGLGAYGQRAGVLALADAGRMKGHSCYAMCGAGAALGELAANTVLTATRQDGQRREPAALESSVLLTIQHSGWSSLQVVF